MPKSKVKKPRTAVYPGTFDPITNGHISLVQRAACLVDNLIVAVAENAGKDPLFTFKERYDLVRDSLKDMKEVRVIKFSGRYLRQRGQSSCHAHRPYR